jgi:hypothetical protein
VTRYVFVLKTQADRENASRYIAKAPAGSRVEVKAPRRTLPQNTLMWSLLTDMAAQLPWHGKRLRPDDYKVLFLDALKRESEAVPNLNGSGFCTIESSSSDLSKAEMSDMIELIYAFGANHGVEFHQKKEENSRQRGD